VAGKVAAWVWVVTGIAVVGILALIAIVGAGFFFVSRHIDTAAVTPADAAAAIETERARFGGQTPIIELDEHGQFVRTHTEGRDGGPVERPANLYLLAYNPADARIVRFRLPFWVLRTRAGGGAVEVEGTRLDLQDLKLTVDDLERYGPALLVDHQAPDGQHVLVWSQ
jgi:hypothetical protein